MLKSFIEENKNLKEAMKNLQKANISSPSTQMPSEKKQSFSPLISKSRTVTFHTEVEPQNPLFKLPTMEYNRQGLIRSSTLKDQMKRSKGNVNVSKGVFTTSRNFVKNQNTSKNY